ncbi:MAG: CvpA family protein [Candidatus Omnitrophica bacterium]|nr:CvpA family protein [Candidatus Omnitrophota bacterium]
MLAHIIRQFNWFDIVLVLLILRILFLAVKSGLSIEIFKFLGTLTAVYFALHYYTVLSDFILSRANPRGQIPLEFLDFIIFIGITIVSYGCFVLLRMGFHQFITLEAVPQLDKWGGFVLGVARSILVAGLVSFMCTIASVGYLKRSVQHSLLGQRFFYVAPHTYTWLWDSVASKFTSEEKINPTILKVKEGFPQ